MTRQLHSRDLWTCRCRCRCRFSLLPVDRPGPAFLTIRSSTLLATHSNPNPFSVTTQQQFHHENRQHPTLSHFTISRLHHPARFPFRLPPAIPLPEHHNSLHHCFFATRPQLALFCLFFSLPPPSTINPQPQTNKLLHQHSSSTDFQTQSPSPKIQPRPPPPPSTSTTDYKTENRTPLPMWLGEWGRVSVCLYSQRCGQLAEGAVGAGISRTCEIRPALADAFESAFEPALFESNARMQARMHAGRQARRHQRPRGRWEQVKTSLTHLRRSSHPDGVDLDGSQQQR